MTGIFWRTTVRADFSAHMVLIVLMVLLTGAISSDVLAQTGKDAKKDEKKEEVDAATKKLNAAYGFYREQQYKFAVEELGDFLTQYPSHPEAVTARYVMAISQYRLARHEDTIKTLTDLLGNAKFQQRDEALAIVGYCQLALKQQDKALAAFDELLTKHPTSKLAESAAMNKAQVLYMLDKKPEALKACKAFIEKYPASMHRANGLYTLALTQHSLAQYADGETALAELLKIEKSPYALDATMLIGQCQDAQGKHAQAIASFTAFLGKAPIARRAEGLYRLAVAQHNDAKFDDATKQLKSLLTDHATSPFAPPARLQLGKTQYDAGKLSDSRGTLGEVAAKDADRANEAKYWLAQCDIAEKKHDSALKVLDQLAAAKPALPNLDEIEFFRAVCNMQLENYNTSAPAFAAFRVKFKDSARVTEATYHEAFSQHRLKKYAESKTLCEQVVALKDKTWSYPAGKLLAENLFLAGQYAPAAAQYTSLQQQTASGPEKVQFGCRLIQCAYFAGDFKKAIELSPTIVSEKQVAEVPELRRVIFLYGDALLQTKQFKQAIAPLQQYLKLNKTDEEASYKLGVAQRESGDDVAALATFADVNKGIAESTWVQNSLLAYGQIAYRGKQPDKAGPALAKVLAAKPAAEIAAPAIYLLAWIDYDAKKYDTAAVGFLSLQKQYAKHELVSDAVFQSGICFAEGGKPAEAIAVFRDYLKTYPAGAHAVAARHRLATALTATAKNDESLVELTKLSVDKAGRSDSVLYDLAWSQRTLKKPDDAIKSYQAILTEFKESKLLTPVRVELAELLYAKDQHKEAAALLEAALADKTADAKTLAAGQFRLGWCYTKLNDHPKAAAAFSAYAAANPKDAQAPTALYQAGMSYRETKKLSEAIAAFSTLVSQHPKDTLAAAAKLRLGETQADAAQWAPSAQAYQAFLKDHADSEFAELALFGLGWALEQQKNYDEARKMYAKVIEVSNTVTAARAQFQIGETHFSQKNYELAAKELLKVELVYAYKDWSATALYEAGRAFEAMNKADDARAQYTKCIEKYADQDAAKLARQRLDALKSAGL
ncbi:MAG: tetratricopeptide repeat protein [Phycisphaeraceae bacterium]